jgi:hypothetical protein
LRDPELLCDLENGWTARSGHDAPPLTLSIAQLIRQCAPVMATLAVP